MANESRYWAVIPAAGVGQRMQADRPKQYLPLAGKTVLEHSLQPFLAHPAFAGVVLALQPHDPWFSELDIQAPKALLIAPGGAERCHSVSYALEVLLASGAKEQDWVLVHDAARPCLSQKDLNGLIEALSDDAVGGILASPVGDTLKRDDGSGLIAQTLDRTGVWRALTPQMFRLGMLHQALSSAIADGAMVTDEAGAMERAGYMPKLVSGSARNIKITRPEDLDLAEFYWRSEQ